MYYPIVVSKFGDFLNLDNALTLYYKSSIFKKTNTNVIKEMNSLKGNISFF